MQFSTLYASFVIFFKITDDRLKRLIFTRDRLNSFHTFVNVSFSYLYLYLEHSSQWFRKTQIILIAYKLSHDKQHGFIRSVEMLYLPKLYKLQMAPVLYDVRQMRPMQITWQIIKSFEPMKCLEPVGNVTEFCATW